MSRLPRANCSLLALRWPSVSVRSRVLPAGTIRWPPPWNLNADVKPPLAPHSFSIHKPGGAPMLGNINPGALTNGRTLTCAPVHDAAVHPRSSDDPMAADPIVYAASHSRWLIVLFLSVIVAALGWAIGSSVFQVREVPPVIVLLLAGFVCWLWHYHARQLAIEITLWPDTGQIRFHAPLGYRETNISTISTITCRQRSKEPTLVFCYPGGKAR